MNERVNGLVARTGGERPVASTAVATFLAFPPQDEPHDRVQAPFASVTGTNRDHAREIVGAIPDPFS
jgi:hypothetical protein